MCVSGVSSSHILAYNRIKHAQSKKSRTEGTVMLTSHEQYDWVISGDPYRAEVHFEDIHPEDSGWKPWLYADVRVEPPFMPGDGFLDEMGFSDDSRVVASTIGATLLRVASPVPEGASLDVAMRDILSKTAEMVDMLSEVSNGVNHRRPPLDYRRSTTSRMP